MDGKTLNFGQSVQSKVSSFLLIYTIALINSFFLVLILLTVTTSSISAIPAAGIFFSKGNVRDASFSNSDADEGLSNE